MNIVDLLLLESPILSSVLIFILGACIGSFLNVVIYRLPIMLQRNWENECLAASGNPEIEHKTLNLFLPHSHCPACNTPIKPWHNLPIIGWILVGGKCAHCKTSISYRYPLIELAVGLLTLYLVVGQADILVGVFYCLITWWLVALIMIDYDTYLLPDQLTLSLLWLGLGASIMGVSISPHDAIIGAMVGYLSLWSVYWLFKLITGKEGMGYGDFKLLAALGSLVGAKHILTLIIIASVTGVLLTVFQSRGKVNPDKMIPFGPFLGISGWIVLLWGDEIQRTYWAWLGY